jgi:outer membrane protein OmpA-like peptidoglycan-associated protein/tetratricopeptide (TPR) repeat protein
MKIKISIILVSLFFVAIAAQAQPLDASRPEYVLQIADEKFEAKDYFTALDWYTKYYDATKDRSVVYKMGLANMYLRDYAKAETNFSRSLARDKNAASDGNPDARFYYGMMLKMNEKYDEALVAFEEYLKAETTTDENKKTWAKTELEGAKLGMRMKENPKLLLENVGDKVNSPNAEYSPSVTSDGSTLYFAAMRDAKVTVLDGKEGDYFTKIYKATKANDGTWNKADVLTGDVNRMGNHQGNVSVSADGRVMYFTRFALTGNDIGESKIYYAMRQGDAWGAANEVRGINGNWIAKHPCLGELYGKPVIFFASNMTGSKGGYDIFYASRVDDGEFSAPVNLGASINTAGDDVTPFYQNGNLYFSSNGHVNIGGLDIFKSSWNGSDWSKPENIGKGYNSSADDTYFTMDADGNTYFTSNRPGPRSLKGKTCCDDIYTVKKEPVVITVEIDVVDAKSNNPIKGSTFDISNTARKGSPIRKTADKYIEVIPAKNSYIAIISKPGYYNDTLQYATTDIDKSTTIKKTSRLRPLPIVTISLKAMAEADGKPLTNVNFILAEAGATKADGKTGDVYTSTLTKDKTYRLVAMKQGYTSDTLTFNTKGIESTTEIEKLLKLKVRMVTIKKNEPIKLENIFYKYDKYEATSAHMESWDLAQTSMNYLYDIMTKYPDMVIELSSHTDSRGTDDYNQKLSQRRADGVKKYLVEKGIDEKRIQPKGYGENQLVNTCGNGSKCSEEEHLKNRRTEFKILSGPTSIEITEQQPAVKN